jgi:hypothetical protein
MRLHPSRWLVAVAVACIAVQHLLSDTRLGNRESANSVALAFDACPDIPSDGQVQNIEIAVKTPDGSCTLASGGYIKKSISYKYHFAASVTGACTVMVQSCSGVPTHCTCIPSQTDVRNLGTTWLYDNGPTSFGAISPTNAFTIQNLDTRVPTGTGSTGVSYTFVNTGRHTITSNTGWNATTCMLTPSTISAPPFVVNVLACKPEWNINPNPNTPNVMHVPPTTITMYIPPNFWSTLVGPSGNGPAVGAVNDLNTWLSGTGVHINIDSVDCEALGPSCIKVGEVPADNIPNHGCAALDHQMPNSTTGEYTDYLTINLGDIYWPAATAARLQRTIAHELEHALGQGHKPSCSLLESLMSSPMVGPGQQFPTVFAACTQSTGMTSNVNDNDGLPTKGTPYGDQVRSVCGF